MADSTDNYFLRPSDAVFEAVTDGLIVERAPQHDSIVMKGYTAYQEASDMTFILRRVGVHYEWTVLSEDKDD